MTEVVNLDQKVNLPSPIFAGEAIGGVIFTLWQLLANGGVEAMSLWQGYGLSLLAIVTLLTGLITEGRKALANQ